MIDAPEDRVVEDIRQIRREVQERFGSDVDALCDFLSHREAEHSERLVNRPARDPEHVAVPASIHDSRR
jgi:hypothetical protein